MIANADTNYTCRCCLSDVGTADAGTASTTVPMSFDCLEDKLAAGCCW